MPDQIKQIGKKLLDIWKKYTKRQRVIILSTIGTVLLTLIILIILLNQISYEKLITFEDTETAKSAIQVLETEGIAYRLEEDMLTVDVDVKKKQDAVLALTGNEIMSETEFTIAQLLDNDLSTTSNDKILKNHLYMQSYLSDKINTIDGVEKASVIYFPGDSNNSILMPEKEISCSVMLTIGEDFDFETSPVGIATYVAYAIGNETLDKIKVIDQHGNLLYGGEEEDEDIQDLNTNLAYKKTVEKWYDEKLFELAIKNDFSDAEIVSALDVNCDRTSILYTEYLAGEGLEQGLYDEYTKITSESTGGTQDIPGTDSNNEIDYYIENTDSGSSAYEETRIKYKPSERVTETVKEWGVINPENSSLAITLTRIRTYTETDLNTLGLLTDTTFDEYVLNNSEKTRIEIGEEYYQLFSDASGIPAENISITAYLQPNYIADEETETDISLYLEIALAVLIIGLLLFVVFRAMKPEEIVETEPELSVERLLATTKENQSLEDIEFGESSEMKKMIEKYVDENAEAVAALLRNWLNDDGWE